MTFNNTGSQRQSKPHPMLGAQLGQYRILEVLGGGGMGIVFKARQEMVDRDVALKLLPPELAADEINAKRLEREAKALAKLNHPNIVTTFDFGLTGNGQPYLVMELVDGLSLKEVLQREERLEMSRAVRIFIQMADAMRFAHLQGIVHRDLKPHNVMLAQAPSPDFVKVLDFGIARLTQESQMLTRAGEIIGSPLYMSPEQCLSDPVDARTDVYAMGVLMYQCLTGHVPYKGETLYETVEKKCTQPLPKFSPDLQIPSFLEELVAHCLAVEPKDRFQSMDELKELLESLPIARDQRRSSDATNVTGSDKRQTASQERSIPKKTIKERMKESGSRQAATSSRSSGSGRRSAEVEQPKESGFVLTPGVMAILAIVLLVGLGGVVMGMFSVYYLGNIRGHQEEQIKHGTKDGAPIQQQGAHTQQHIPPAIHRTLELPPEEKVETTPPPPVETSTPSPPATTNSGTEIPTAAKNPDTTSGVQKIVKVKKKPKRVKVGPGRRAEPTEYVAAPTHYHAVPRHHGKNASETWEFLKRTRGFGND